MICSALSGTTGTDRYITGTCTGGIPHPETVQTVHTPLGVYRVPVPGDACGMLPGKEMLCTGACTGAGGERCLT